MREYRRRWRAEATFQDCKKRGWDIERSKVTEGNRLPRATGYRGQQVTEGNRLNRLLLVLFLALWWAHALGTHALGMHALGMHALGMRAVKLGLRRLFDRSDRRELSVVHLGGRWVQHLLDRDRPHPALLRYRPSPDSFTTLC